MNKKPKEQVIIGPMPPPVGGVSSAVQNLKQLFIDSNVQFKLFSTSSGNAREDLYAKKNLGQFFRFIKLFVSFIIFFIKNRDSKVCHLFVVSNIAFIRDFLFLLVLKVFGKKVVVHLHSKTSGEFFVKSNLIRLFGKCLSLADSILVLSDEHKSFFSRYIKGNKVSVLENFIFSKDFTTNKVKNNEWLYVGRLTEQKGFYDLLSAVDVCVNKHGYSGIIINCLGLADTDENQHRIEKFIEDKKLKQHIKLYGIVVGKEKFNFFKSCKGLIFPSHFENSPVVLKEAICAEMPIISSDIDANKNILSRIGNNIFFETKNSTNLAEAIIKLESDNVLFLKLRVKAKNGFKHDTVYAKAVIHEVLNDL